MSVFSHGNGARVLPATNLGGGDAGGRVGSAVWSSQSVDATALASFVALHPDLKPRAVFDANADMLAKYGWKPTMQGVIQTMRKHLQHAGKENTRTTSAKKIKFDPLVVNLLGRDGDDDDNENDDEEPPPIENFWSPLYVANNYRDYETHLRHFSVAIALPSGVFVKGEDNFEASLENDNRTLVVKCIWPKWMRSKGLEDLHKKFNKAKLNSTTYHNRLQAMNEALEDLKSKCDGRLLHSVFRLPIGFEGDPQFESSFIRNKEDGGCSFYIDIAEVAAKKPKAHAIEYFDESTPPEAAPPSFGAAKKSDE